MRVSDLFEAPIEDFTHVGDWTKSSSFRHEQDRKLLTNPKAIRKITAQWEKTPVNFNMYFVNNSDGTKSGNSEIGMVDSSWIAKNLPKTAPFIDIKPDAINVLFMNNSGSERVPMTGWIIAHRFGHVVSRYGYGGRGGRMERQVYDFTEARNEIFRVMAYILNDGYGYGSRVPDSESRHTYSNNYEIRNANDKLLVAFYEQIGTMRSARTGAIRNEFEFTLELLAQYLLTGRIKFNPIPKRFSKGRSVHAYFRDNEDDMEYYNQMLTDLADTLKDHFLNLLHTCVGEVFVM